MAQDIFVLQQCDKFSCRKRSSSCLKKKKNKRKLPLQIFVRNKFVSSLHVRLTVIVL